MKRTIVVLLALLALLAVALPAQAGTTTNGPLTITATDQTLQSSCYHYTNVTYTVDAAHWFMTVDITKPDAWGDSDFLSGDGPGSGLVSDYLCDSVDGPGTYTVHAVLTPYDTDYNALPEVVADTTFSLIPYVAPVPPPVVTPPVVTPPVVTPPAPVPAPVVKVATRLGIAVMTSTSPGTITTLRRGKTAYVGARLLRGTHYLNGARVTLRAHQIGRAWHNVSTPITATMAGHKGMAIVKVRPRHTIYYQWVYAGNSTSKASHSATKRTKVV